VKAESAVFSFVIAHPSHQTTFTIRTIMRLSHRIHSISLILCYYITIILSSTLSTLAFRIASHTPTPLKIQSIHKSEIEQRLGRPSNHNLQNEHEVLCPLTNSHQGIICTTNSWEEEHCFRHAESIANNHELVNQAIYCGSLAASIRNRESDGDSLYYLPFVITLVESFMADEVSSMLMDEILARDYDVQAGCKDCNTNMASSLVQDMIFNSGGLETNEILLDLSDVKNDAVMIYACNTQMDEKSATSDVYLIPKASQGRGGKVWRFTIDYKVATVNLSEICSFGQGESTMPLRPDVWLKDDYF